MPVEGAACTRHTIKLRRWDAAATDRVVLDAGDRNRRRIVLTGEKGTEFLLDFAKPVTLARWRRAGAR